MLQLQWAVPLNFPVMWQWSLTFLSSFSMSFSHPTRYLTKIVLLLHSWSNFCWSVFCHFFALFILPKNCFNKFISSIYISKNNYWISKFIINTNKFVSKTTRNVILIFFWVRTFITVMPQFVIIALTFNTCPNLQ